MPGGRPTKPLALVKGHRTKAEKAVREKAEKELLTGTSLKEWDEVKSDPTAHKEFIRIKKLLKSIKQDDDLYGAVINTHCKLKSEEYKMLRDQEKYRQSLDKLEEEFDESTDMSFSEYMKLTVNIQKNILACDKAISEKRKLMLNISKENVMTIQSALRSIPKKPEESKQKSAMAEFLKRKVGEGNAT